MDHVYGLFRMIDHVGIVWIQGYRNVLLIGIADEVGDASLEIRLLYLVGCSAGDEP